MTTYEPTNVTLPATPNIVAASDGPPANGESPDPRPLITVTDYQRITGDKDSEPADVKVELDNAIEMAGGECKRSWLYGQYSEELFSDSYGWVTPSATPLDTAQPVMMGDPPVAGSSTVQGARIWVGWWTPEPWMPVWIGLLPPQALVTYWGGYTATTIPEKLKRIFARLAWYCLHPVTLEGMPAGAKSTSGAGISVSGILSIITTHDPQLKRDLHRFRRPQVRAWQS